MTTILVLFLLVIATPASCAESTNAGKTPTTTLPNRLLRPQDLSSMTSTDSQEWVSFHRTVQFLPANNNNNNNNNMNHEEVYNHLHYGNNAFDSTRAAQQLALQLEQQQQQKGRPSLEKRRRKLEDEDEQEEEAEEEEEPARGQSNTDDVYSTQPFVEGISEYDEYQQAWRLLGFMIDCDDMEFNMDDDGNNNGNSGSWDGGTGEGCHRYVLWAAYVDLEYEGGGIGEYQFWNRENQVWDDRSCAYSAANGGNNGGSGDNNNNNNGDDNDGPRCAKMDCHLPDTHWSLLGFFKHQSLDDWFGQLFKHEGMCIWSQEEYAFMKNAKGAWPGGCSESSTVMDDGNPIYYDVKPVSGGGIAFGLYTDTRCTVEYRSRGRNDPISTENVLGNLLMDADASGSQDENYQFDPDDYSLAEAMAMWEHSFDAFKICQPCVAYDLNNVGYNADDDAMRGSAYGTYRYGYDDDYTYNYYYGGDVQGDDFDCYDDAGYTNVNQCMKFMAKTYMQTATFRDLSLANLQGTLVGEPMEGKYADSAARRQYYRRTAWGTFLTYVFFLFSMSVLTFGVFVFYKVRKEEKFTVNWKNYKEPLVFT